MPAKRDLIDSAASLGKDAAAMLEKGDYTKVLNILAGMKKPVDAFFDGVMVNADDDALRNNRLNLLQALRQGFLQVADISQLAVGK